MGDFEEIVDFDSYPFSMVSHFDKTLFLNLFNSSALSTKVARTLSSSLGGKGKNFKHSSFVTKLIKPLFSGIPDADSRNGTGVVERIKSRMEKLCPGVVSCADILAVAARESVVALDAPSWSVRLGRRDSTTANLSAITTDLPSAYMDLHELLITFGKKKFTAREMVALTGGDDNIAPLDPTTPNHFDSAYYQNLRKRVLCTLINSSIMVLPQIP
ncbi:hypothetical protein VNO78_25546 [Psophocarpus tetragonolobus]|uniref:peroxidase n=1 Tax=Psophocarpus tetragonolobus TaxID=3891 RepID=A0AAN9S7B6_PSOTE